MTAWVMRLLAANGILFLLQMTIPGFGDPLVLVPGLLLQRPWTLISYMFLHGGLGHIFFNMLALFFFGPRLELRLGSRNFLILYLASGIAGALASLIFTPWVAIIGASGAVFGVMLGFAYFWPRDQILIWGILPIEARWLILAMTALALLGGFTGGDGVAHWAHLGGFAGGFLSLKFFEWSSPAKAFRRRMTPAAPRETTESSLARWKRIRREELHEVNRAELDRILDQISAQGIGSLTQSDREFLERFSARSNLH